MIAAWILFALVVGLFLGAGALVLEKLLRAHRLPTRWIWAGTMGLTLFWPLGHILWKVWPRESVSSSLPPPSRIAVLDPLAVQVTQESLLRTLDGPILLMWVVCTSVLLVFFGVLVIRTRRLRKGWEKDEATGRRVLFSQDMGPAVVGYMRPEIVLPGWCRDLEDQTLEMIIDHEVEHLKAGDLRLMLTAGVLPLLFPWHLALWWQFKRLRLAVEGDCDLRIVRKHPKRIRPYMELLLDVGGREPRMAALLAMLSEPEDTLAQRIRIMTMPFPEKPWLRGLSLASLGAVLLAVACWAPSPREAPEEEADVAVMEAVETPGEGTASGSDDPSSAPTFTPYTVRPDIRNRAEVVRALEREYPPLLRDAGIGGSVQVWFFIEDDGAVQTVLINESSGHQALDEAALRVARSIQFTPALNRDETVPVWISLPITFSTRPETARTKPTNPEVEVMTPVSDRFSTEVREETPAKAFLHFLRVTVAYVGDRLDGLLDRFTRAVGQETESTAASAPDPTPNPNPETGSEVADAPVPTPAASERDPRWPEPPGVEGARKDLASAPAFTPYTVRPDIENRSDVARALEREYPPLLRDAGIGGTAQIWFFIDDSGAVQTVQINKSSGHQALDEAALRVARLIQFTPAMNRDEPVPVWISLPITFTVR